MLTSQARAILASVRFVIVDEVHAVAGTKRGAHLALSLERLERLVGPTVPAHRPLGHAASARGDRALRLGRPADRDRRRRAGRRSSTSRSSSRSRTCASCPAPPASRPRHATASRWLPGVRLRSRSIWPSIYPAILELVEAHRSTIVFVNNRRLAERLALRLNELAEKPIARAHHGSLAREQRVEIEELLEAGRDPVPRRHVVARARYRHGRGRSRHPGRVAEVGRARSAAGRPCRPYRSTSRRRAASSRSSGATCSSRPSSRSGCARERSRRRRSRATRSTSSPSRSWRSRADEEIAVDELHELVRGAWNFRDLSRAALENVLDMLCRPLPVRGVRGAAPAIVWDRVKGVVRGREGARRLAITNAGTIPDRGSSASSSSTAAAGSASSTRRWSTRPVRGRRSCSARRPGGSRTSRATGCSSRRRPGSPAQCRSGRARGRAARSSSARRSDARRRELVALDDEQAARAPHRRARLDERAADNLVTYLREQEEATGVLPSDRTVVVERFRDEIGDWRLVHPHAVRRPRSRAVGARARHAAARLARARGERDLVGRRHRAPPAGRRGAAARPDVLDRARRARGPRRRELAGQRALRRALPGERRARAAHPAASARPADAALAAAAEGAGRCSRSRAATPTSRSCSRRTASASRTCSTCRRCRRLLADLEAAVSTSSRSRRRPRRPSPPRSSSTTSRPTCTRTTRRWPSGAPRRSPLDRDLLRELLGAEELRDLLDRAARRRGRGRAARPGADPRRAARPAAAPRRPHAGGVRPRRSPSELERRAPRRPGSRRRRADA